MLIDKGYKERKYFVQLYNVCVLSASTKSQKFKMKKFVK
jgi:hypothetical protein